MPATTQGSESQALSPSADAPAIAAPQAPDVAPGRPTSIITVGPDGKPLTLALPTSEDELEELIAQRRELRDQLESVSDRRTNLAQELAETVDPAARVGLEGRLSVLDNQILQLENDLAVTGRQLTAAPAELVSHTEHQNLISADDGFEDGMMAGGFTVLFFATVLGYFLRRRWKRARPARAAEVADASSQRLERLEQGMDAIAVEIERISEGQRFVTRLLSESQVALAPPKRLAKAAKVPRDDPAAG